VLGQAAGFALLAAVSPTALLVMAVLLGSANPRGTALMYVAGAIIMTVAMAVVVLFVLLTYLAYPEATTRRLRTANEWLRLRGRVLVIGALWIAGVILVVDGALGLSQR
jgi:uncharacterized protein (DUF2342 family)